MAAGHIHHELIIANTMPDDRAKDDFAETIKKRVLEMRAIGIVFISEAWSLSGADGATPDMTSVRHHPKRREIVWVQLEHVCVKDNWVAFIDRDAAGKGTLQAFRRTGSENARGRFAHLLYKGVS